MNPKMNHKQRAEIIFSRNHDENYEICSIRLNLGQTTKKYRMFNNSSETMVTFRNAQAILSVAVY